MLIIATALALFWTPSALQAQNCAWDARQLAPQAIVEAQSVVIDDKLYLMGGFYSSALLGTPRTDVYDPLSDSWTGLADMLTVVTHHTAVVDGQQIWCAGGFFGDNGGFVVDAVQVYDVLADSWSTGPRLPARRAGGAMVRLGRELHYFGGFSTRRLNADDHYVLDLDNPGAGWDSSSFAPLPMGRGQLSGAVLNGFIYAIGGQFGHDLAPVDLDLVHRYDPSTNTWTQVASLPSPRSHFEASTFVYQGRIFVAGGRNNQLSSDFGVREISAYDPSSDSWTNVSHLPVGLLGPSAKAIGDLLYVTAGGLRSNAPLASNYVRAVEPVLGEEANINAGGSMLSLASDWCADTFFEGGVAGSSDLVLAIAGTVDDELYLSERSSTLALGSRFAYRLPVENGNYRLGLYFADYSATMAGERVFDVSLEGSLILDDYDIVGEVGALSADQHGFDIVVQDGVLDLEFMASVGQPKLSALEVTRLPDDAFGIYCQGAPNSAGPGARMYFVGSTSLLESNLRLVVSGLPAGSLARFVLGTQQGMQPFGSGSFCLAGFLLFSPIYSVGANGVIQGFLPTDQALAGSRFNFQAIYTDQAPFRFNASDAFLLSFTP